MFVLEIGRLGDLAKAELELCNITGSIHVNAVQRHFLWVK